MKKLFTLLLLVAAMTVNGAEKKTNLKVLYVGGHSNMDTDATVMDSAAIARDIQERKASFEQFLNTYFTTVKVIDASEYNYLMSNDYDVTVMDGQPRPLEPKQVIRDGDRYVKTIEAKFFPDDFDRPVLTIAELGKTIGGRLGLKTDWYCLCLDQWAHGMRTSHPIFKGPYKVTMTLEDKPTPDGAKEFAPLVGQKLPETTPMWRVNTKGYMTDPGFKVGMVSRPWGFEDSPEAEWISSGLCAKSIDAMALGRHGSFFHWGFAAAPMDMTEEAKPLLANAIVYISKFAGQRVIARKLYEGIATRIEAKENAFRVTRECYNMYKESLENFNKQMLHFADSVKAVVAAGGKVSERESIYLQWKPQEIPSREDFLREMAGPLYDDFGTNEQAYAKYYAENTPYFFGTFNGYGLQLDTDAKSLGIPNNDLRLMEKAIELWESGQDAAKGRRLLERYTLLRYDNPQQYKAWIEKNRSRLFFTESGGWLWLMNSQEKNVEGNDYSVLHFHEKPATPKPALSQEPDGMNPVVVSAMLADRDGGKDLVIRIKMFRGWHIYGYVSEQDPYIATTFDIQLPDGWQKDGDMQLPAFRTEPTGTTLYEGDVVLRQPLKGSGHGPLRLTVNYQSCDEHACLPPRDAVIDLEL